MNEKIAIGVIGAHAQRGWARAVHLAALNDSPDFAIAAVASTDADQAAEAAQVWGAERAYGDAHELLADPAVEAVLIAVQLPKRGDLVEAAIKAGKHVYVEWPLALDAATAERHRDSAAAHGVQHAVGLQTRHHPAIRHLRQLIAEGTIGEVLSASLHYSIGAAEAWSERYADLFDETKGVNHLAVVGGHAMDQFAHAVGRFTAVSGRLATRIPEVEIIETGERLKVTSPDQILAHGVLESGAPASVHIMTGGPAGAGYRIEVQGRSGRLVLASADDSLVAPRYRLTREDAGGAAVVPVPERFWTGGSDNPSPSANAGETYRGFAAAIRTGAPQEPNFDTAIAVHRVQDAIRRSNASGANELV
ncbi:Gfo/Idh/MocA family protein [Glycomyces algeriensis]|uniref:Oxidoreductase n=1 Tax=Glycomyces algeriensis TaxID=256037 RepID=A0A9W6GCG7_9ACTN|nr:Gfo/Idh/MocA family oxidoreductase [Glycomyces algeriensis]MDA1365828.1 Gfo/Idh/MocA family oxidoreductase [Glycomyces algeriensis]MDR7351517.1 putative dehydrogenase [Glycomyces algeriensis]GLI44238.1 oxidoreductase [Glycomyces algeriensis]